MTTLVRVNTPNTPKPPQHNDLVLDVASHATRAYPLPGCAGRYFTLLAGASDPVAGLDVHGRASGGHVLAPRWGALAGVRTLWSNPTPAVKPPPWLWLAAAWLAPELRRLFVGTAALQRRFTALATTLGPEHRAPDAGRPLGAFVGWRGAVIRYYLGTPDAPRDPGTTLPRGSGERTLSIEEVLGRVGRVSRLSLGIAKLAARSERAWTEDNRLAVLAETGEWIAQAVAGSPVK